MTGPEHYAEAERLLAPYVSGRTDHNGFEVTPPSDLTALAQVHATLALSAAQNAMVDLNRVVARKGLS